MRAGSKPFTPDSVGTFNHVLFIGGTGMLRAASVALASRAQVLTSIARTQRSLDALDQELAGVGCVHRMRALDWEAPDRFFAGVRVAVRENGLPELVVAWFHGDAMGLALGHLLGGAAHECRLFQVLGRAAGAPSAAAGGIARELGQHGSLTYGQVILGAHRTAAGSRWLTHPEIAAGTLEAIASGSARYVVGTL